MAREKVLVVDDEEDILQLVTFNLLKEGFAPSGVLTGEEALSHARLTPPDSIILDIMLPGMDGLEVCGHLRREPRTRNIPIIMLTAKGEEADVIAGLEVGADDYIVKPFSTRVLVARVRAALRRRQDEPVDNERAIALGDMSIHPGRHEVTVAGNAVSLTLMEFRVLHFLALHPGWVHSRNQIIDSMRVDTYPVADRIVDVTIVGLRRKLGCHGGRIETVRGVGYRLREDYCREPVASCDTHPLDQLPIQA
jgi:two-component system phosphate regulon response regulator PhoB